jgi:threonine 3-dehydrogenase
MRTLMTGAGGQVGQDLVALLRARGDDVVASDVTARPSTPGPVQEVPWHALDVTDPRAVSALVAQVKPDRIFHLAAILSARGEAMPQLTYAVNQTGTWNVLEACREHGVRQVIFTSTIAAFGPGLPDLVGDDVPLRPTTMYGVTKVAGELLGEYYARKYDLDFRAVRFPGLISASLPGGGTSDYALFMYWDGVRVGHYESFCRPDTRIPLMYMPDGLRALVELAAAPRSELRRCVYNIAAFSPTAEEIAHSVRGALPGVRLTFAPDPLRQGILDSWPRALDDRNAREDWGWRPQFDLAAMTADLVPQVRTLVAAHGDRPAHH